MTRRRALICCLLSFALGGMSAAGAIVARRALATHPGVPSSGAVRVVVAGNSLATAPFAAELGRLLGPGWQVVGRAIGGQPTTRMIAEAGAIDRLLVPGGRNVLVVWEGTNDLFFGATAEDAASRLAGYCEARRRAGWRVVVLTVLPRAEPGTPATFEADRRAVNARLRSGPWAVADVAAIPLLADPLDRRSYADRTHLTPLGNSLVAAHAAAAVLSLRR